MAMDGTRHGRPYTHCYCEENIYHLAASLSVADRQHAYVVLISNADRMVPFWRQYPEDHDRMLVWDYHVIMMSFGVDGTDPMVYDFDSDVSFPISFAEYAPTVLRLQPTTAEVLPHRFRVIPAQTYLDTFASDRSHMLVNGRHIEPPPTWPVIRGRLAADSPMVLDDFISMSAGDDGCGSLSAAEFWHFAVLRRPEIGTTLGV